MTRIGINSQFSPGDGQDPSPSEVLAMLPAAEAERARRAARKSACDLLVDLAVIEPGNESNDPAMLRLNWRNAERALFGEPCSEDVAGTSVTAVGEGEIQCFRDKIAEILHVFATRDFEEAAGRARQLLDLEHDTVVECATRTIQRHLTPEGINVRQKLQEAMQRYRTARRGEETGNRGEVPILLTSLAYFAAHLRAQSRLRRSRERHNMRRALGESLAYHTT